MERNGRVDRCTFADGGADLAVAVKKIRSLAHAQDAEVVARNQAVPIQVEPDAIVNDGDGGAVSDVVNRDDKAGGLGVTDHISHGLLDDSKEAHLSLGRSAHDLTNDNEIGRQVLVDFQINEESTNCGHQSVLVQSGRVQAAGDFAKVADDTQQLFTNGDELLVTVSRVAGCFQDLEASGQLK